VSRQGRLEKIACFAHFTIFTGTTSMKMKFAIAIASLALSTTAHAVPIVVGQWYTFGFGGVGSALVDGTGFTLGTNPAAPASGAPPWTFTLAGLGTLTVLDGFDSGDRFTMSDFGAGIGTTSVPVTGTNCGSDIGVCSGTAAMSKATFNLSAGNHSITGVASTSPFGGGAGFFIVRNVQGAIPEAATWAMMLVGFGVVGGALRSRRNTLRVSMKMV
jgi:hypothetical protein